MTDAVLETSLDTPLRSTLEHIQRRTLTETTWMGVRSLMSPTDAWIYQELLAELRPSTIVQVGAFHGGSTLYFAHLCDLLGSGKVLAVDLCPENIDPIVVDHDRVHVFGGDALARVAEVAQHVDASGPVLVIEDSSHTYENTLAVCRAYGDLVTPGSYLVVEATICNHGLDVGPKPGPYEAVTTFLGESDEFQVRRDLEGFLVTWNPSGFLQRVGG